MRVTENPDHRRDPQDRWYAEGRKLWLRDLKNTELDLLIELDDTAAELQRRTLEALAQLRHVRAQIACLERDLAA
jgi:hypothetical protein